MRILVVEDQRRLAATLKDLLAYQKYAVDLAYDGESGLDCALSGIYDGIVLDVMMPKMDGFQVVRQLRQEGFSTPVLMLTAKSETADKVQGLDSGADYYLTKPFEPEEFLACVRALLRRREELAPQRLEYGDLCLDLSACALGCGERWVKLSGKELEMMRILLSNPGAVVPKETLLLKVWGYDSEAEDNHVEVYVSFLRKKLGHIQSQVSITSARRLGYYLSGGAKGAPRGGPNG